MPKISVDPITGFAIITWKKQKKWEKLYITNGLATCQSLGARFSHVSFGSYGGPRIVDKAAKTKVIHFGYLYSIPTEQVENFMPHHTPREKLTFMSPENKCPEDAFSYIEIVPWLVVSTHLKNISQNGNLPQIEVKIKKNWNHHLVPF